MNRRDFLKICLATSAAATFDFEKLLWIPKPMIVVPESPKIYGEIWLERYGEIFGYMRNGKIEYARHYQDVDMIMNWISKKVREEYEKGNVGDSVIVVND